MTIYRRDILTIIDEDTEQQISTKALSKAKVLFEGEESKKFMDFIQGKVQEEDNQSGSS